MDRSVQERYLALLNLPRRGPSLEYLQALVHAHLHRFPFENISKIDYFLHQGGQGWDWFPSVECFLDNFERSGFGGNCYILNGHFGLLLRSLGFHVVVVRAIGGNAHLANRVTIEGRAFYVDVGYGAPLFEALDLEQQPHFYRRGEEISITRMETNRFLIDRRMNGQSIVTKEIEWMPVSMESFAPDITHSLRDEDDNPFMRRVVVTLFKPDAAYAVVNQKLFIRRDEGTEMHEYTSRESWLEMMHSVFGLESGKVEQALRFVEARGVSFFQQK